MVAVPLDAPPPTVVLAEPAELEVLLTTTPPLLLDVEAEAEMVLVGTLTGEMGDGWVLVFTEAWLVTATLTVGVGAVVVSTGTLCVTGTGTTVAVEVLLGAALSI